MCHMQAVVCVVASLACMAFQFEEPTVPRLLLYCRPSTAVAGKPIVARVKTTLAGKEFAARFERDSEGNTRLELQDPRDHAPHFAMLESAKGKLDKWVFYDERTTVVRKWQESSPGSTAWWFPAGFEAEWTNQYEQVAGHDARKIILKAQGSAFAAVECWISESLMVVLRERALGQDTATQEWEVSAIEERQPAEDVLATPPGFRESETPEKR
jgi:hypothetical protein